jgi:hypothetical protein
MEGCGQAVSRLAISRLIVGWIDPHLLHHSWKVWQTISLFRIFPSNVHLRFKLGID